MIVLFIASLAVTSAAFAERITVSAAISLKDALTQVSAAYTKQTGETVEFTFGSSGQLATQIKAGAPVDLFISAANKQVDDLETAGVVDPASRTVVAGNALVAVVPADAEPGPASLQALLDASIKRVAIGEPQSVPAGRYAAQALRHAGVFEALQSKLVLGTNVRQVLNYVERGEVGVGLVYATDARLSGDKVRIAFTVPADHHDAIVYPGVIVSASTKHAAAGKFLVYLTSAAGQQQLRAVGFSSPPNTPATQPTR